MMRTCKNILTVAAIAVTGFCSTPEVVAQTVHDGAYIKEHTKTKRVVPYTHIREADVLWARRVWRTIDLREKMNHPLYYPEDAINDRKSLFDVIRQGLLVDGSIPAYDRLAVFRFCCVVHASSGVVLRFDTRPHRARATQR